MFALTSLALWSVSLATEPVVIREIVCWPKGSPSLKKVASLGTANANGDGSWTVRVSKDTKLRPALDKLSAFGMSGRALIPRWSGEVDDSEVLRDLQDRFNRAKDEFDNLPASLRVTPTKADDEEPLDSVRSKLDSQQPPPASVEAGDVFSLLATTPAVAPQVWTNIGPKNLQVYGTYGNGVPPINGRVNDMAFDFTNPSTIYAASARGGVWKTTNGGQNWNPLSDNWPALNTSVVKTNPGLRNRVYVGTGDEPSNYGTSIGLMVSTNGGTSFTARGVAEFSSYQISDICVVQDQPQTLIVGSGGGTGTRVNQLYRTTNEGVSWNAVVPLPTYWTDLDVSIAGSSGLRHYYAAGHRQGDNCVLYRSDDRGATWNWVSLPVATDADRIYISTSKINSEILYIYYTDQRRVFKNSGPGATWVEITSNLATVSDGEWGQTSYNNGLTCFLRENVLVSHDALFIQNLDAYVTNGLDINGLAGGAWLDFAFGYSGSDKVHVDHHSVAVNPSDPNTFLFATDGGIARCKYDPLANKGEFELLSKNLVATLVSRISIDPTHLDGVLAGMQDNGMAWLAGDTDNWLNLLAGDLGHSAINPSIPGLQYLIPPNLKGGMVETQDGWATRNSRPVDTTGDKMRSSPPIVLDPSNPRFVYVATNYLYRYDSLNKTWESKLGNQMLDPSEHVRHLAVAPSNPLRIYTVSDFGDVWMTKDGGVTWSEVSTGGSSLPNVRLSHISVDPLNDNRVLVGVEDASANFFLYRCLNTDAVVRTWSSVHGIIAGKILPKLPLLSIQRHPDAPSTCWVVGGDFGVWMTFDAGKTWRDLGASNALPMVAVTDVRIHPLGYIFAATYGRGVWRTPTPKVPRGVGF